MKLLLVDGDDTLWRTGHHYEHARHLYIAFLFGLPGVADGHDGRSLYDAFDAHDAAACAAQGHHADRFTESMLHLAQEVTGGPLDAHAVATIRAIGAYPFTQISEPMPGAEAFLKAFARAGAEIVVVTAGDPTIQHKRVRDFPYKRLLTGVRVVDRKTPELFREIVRDHVLRPHQVWMVGNSYTSDIVPARAAGLRTAWLHSYSWSADTIPNPDLTGVLQGDTLKDIRKYIFEMEDLADVF